MILDADQHNQITKPVGVLIIEDDAVLAMDLSAQISALGHVVTGIAMTQAQAVEMAQTTPPCIVVSDIALADMSSGIDAVRDIRTVLPDVPIIFTTGHPELISRADVGVVLPKPFNEAQAAAAIKMVLAKR